MKCLIRETNSCYLGKIYHQKKTVIHYNTRSDWRLKTFYILIQGLKIQHTHMNYAKHKAITHVINKQGLKYNHFTLANHKK